MSVSAEVFHDGVLSDVVRFEFELVVIANTVVEKSILPFDVMGPFVPALPIMHDGGQGIFPRKCDEGVQMVGHEQEKKTAPPTAGMIEVNGVE